MRLKKARIQKYRSIRDTGFFDVESEKTILVGPNEAGKSAVLRALQQLNPPDEIRGFDVLRDYPRSEYNDITTGKVNPATVTIVEGHFALEAEDQAFLQDEFKSCTYVIGRKLDNKLWHKLIGAPEIKKYGDITKDLARLCSHIDSRVPAEEADPSRPTPGSTLKDIINDWTNTTLIDVEPAKKLKQWLSNIFHHVEEGNSKEEERYERLLYSCEVAQARKDALAILNDRMPIFVLFSNYFRVRPLIHLEHLANRLETGNLDDEQYDYGNQCLLKLLGFTARELSNLGRVVEPSANSPETLQACRDQLDRRSYQLNAAEVQLSKDICAVWLPDATRGEADRLRVVADGQYLKVVVEDSLGVNIELNQRSEGFQWLVSFFVVFFAEALGKHENAVLLLDEPGLSLHGLKQRDFRKTLSRLAEKNQTVYSTHSPFLVGPDELDLVRVVEMPDRTAGTKIHSEVASNDPAALLPLQEALGYDLAQSLFTQQRNFILEGLTDYWYLEAVSQLLREAGESGLNDKIALVPAQSAGKVVYFATILHAHKLKVAALLDSDSAGDQAAQQEILVYRLGNTAILRTKDVYTGSVAKPEIEELLRDTLVQIAKTDLAWDVSSIAEQQIARSIVDIFVREISGFSKYKLAKAFVRWSRDHAAADLVPAETIQWRNLINAINKVLK
ncbi:AAA family ATPase [Nitrosospira sp. NpAV]|uniref:AAA family ATPase n=1 Tax=Nitrosospira sp. NpAV TaxID=58133 RepID=UPI00059F0144|nr:AAA family ATPase [Nitrosospira sp. NpAV]KIO48418.1 ATP-dependent OLD family endonuclease [Nitrosospira sp. NpAV]